MSSLERWSLRLGFWLTAATGAGYGWLRYLGVVEGEFGPEPSPWQGTWQHAHVLVAPLLVLALGMAARGHAGGALQARRLRGRRSGLALAVLAGPLVLGGAAVQVVTAAGPRALLGWLHAGAGLLFAAAYLGHTTSRDLAGRQAKPWTATESPPDPPSASAVAARR